MLLLMLFAFAAGIVTILSPCILPVLPIVLSGSLAGGKRRPLGVVTGFVGSFTFFTLALSAIVRATNLPADALRTFAVIVIFFFGLSLIFPQTQLFLEKLFSKLSGMVPQKQNAAGFFGGLIVGLSLGLLWAPCVGPILAAVITLAATSKLSLATVFITFSYAVGSGIPMLAITYGGRKLLQRMPKLLQNTGKIQQFFGALMMIVAIGIYFNADRQFQTWILEKFPQYGAGLTVFEQNGAVQSELQKLRGGTVNVPLGHMDMNGPLAPDFTGGGTWINSQPLSLHKELKGKVVLVDFWTYSCINCIRTLPYLRQWYATYKDQGFVIVGVHSPEFEFEKVTDNVKKAVSDFQISYPVVQDNDYNIWNAYNNDSWPAHYLIDQSGHIVSTHVGEGAYVETENEIRQLLQQKPLNQNEVSMPNQQLTPETYLGHRRADAYVTDNTIENDQTAQYDFSQPIPDDAVALKGSWTDTAEYMMAAQDNASLSLNFLAHQVYLVMDKPASGNGKVTVLMDGQPLPPKYFTKDMNPNGVITVDSARKYDIVDLHGDYGRHTIQLLFSNGTKAFAFTFG